LTFGTALAQSLLYAIKTDGILTMADTQRSQTGEDQARFAGNKKKQMLLVAVILGVMVLSVGATLAALKFLRPSPATLESAAQEQATPPPVPAIYYPLQPPIVVNFAVKGRQRYLQAELTLMTRDGSVISTIELHQSMIRNALILLIGGHSFEDLQTAEGKELLRQSCLQEIQRLLQEEIGRPGIEQVLFTDFVMQ
jgi:flagellar FliL protein